jgi:2-amino-4-hydroxy-6-hydroxymethyldihydropteridine diphosphokinase
MRQRVLAYLGLGANMGDAAIALEQAIAGIDTLPLTSVVKASGMYRTAPLDTDTATPRAAPGGDYVNAVIAVHTGLAAPALLQHLQRLELGAGRVRSTRNAPRPLDIDVLLYGQGSLASKELTVPHPRMLRRAFVLVPLAEIAPALVSDAQLSAVGDQQVERLGPLPVLPRLA